MGPDRIEGGQAPGGIVLRCYGPDGGLIFERLLTPALLDEPGALEAAADADAGDALATVADPLRIVIYDGDSGARMWPTWRPPAPPV